MAAWTERIIPENETKGIVSIHLKRYAFALERCYGGRVLDLGCGVGYGASFLSDKGSNVIGIDLDLEAIRHASARNRRHNLGYLTANGIHLPFGHESFDAVCSFEVIEHVQNHRIFLSEVTRVLKNDGFFIVSTPCAQESNHKPANPHHQQEWSSKDFKDLLEKYFSSVEVWWEVRRQTQAHRWLQKLDVFNLRGRLLPIPIARAIAGMTRTVSFADLGMEDLEIRRDFAENVLCQIAVCKQPK